MKQAEGKNSGNERNSVFEVLRILAILMIICSHYSVHGGVSAEDLLQTNFRNAVILHFCVQGNLGVDIFVVLSGYFMVHSSMKSDKIVRLVLQVCFYSVICYLIFLLSGRVLWTPLAVIKALFPTTFKTYWFFTAYVVLMLLSPLLNHGILSMSRESLKRLIIAACLIWSVIPTVASLLEAIGSLDLQISFYSNEVIQFIMLYLTGAYLSLYPSCRFNRFRVGITAFILCISGMFLSSTVIDLVILKTGHLSGRSNILYTRNSPLVIMAAVSLLIIMIHIPAWRSRWVNQLASCVFGVYLLHDNPYVRTVLWPIIVQTEKHMNDRFLGGYIIFIAVSVFLVCAGIEWMRKKFLEPVYMRGVNWLIARIPSGRSVS